MSGNRGDGAEIGDDQHIISSAKKNLSEILENDSLSVDRSTPTLSVGNSHGHAWAMLPQRVTNLTLSVKAYDLIRHRFLVNYKQSQLGIINEADQKYVNDGNSIVHGGGVKANAELYKDVTLHRRDDFPVFKSLYGCIPQVIWPISRSSTLSTLRLDRPCIRR
ncbi:hypothetical protein HOY80DRAFT_566069 [Tuber brumale]|nr:hypothetical protein HOY80DRAFT_566069 [Tuber brumale]